MKRRFSKLLSALLALAMLLTLLPTAAFAAGETGTFTKITTQEELTSGQYVMTVSTGYAVGEYDDNNGNPWLLAYSITQEAEELINPAANLVWDITVTEDGVTLTDANGVQVAPKGGNTNGIQAGSYTWAVNFTDGAFRFLGTGSDTVTLASNKSSENKFRAYKNTTINAGYPYDFTLYQYVEGTGSTDPDPGEDPDPQPSESPIADGDRVVIYNPTYMKALSSEKTGNYNVGTDLIILDDGKVTGYGDTDVWTVVENEDSSYSFQQDGQNIGISEGFTSLNLGAADDDWTLVALEDGTYNVKNVTRGNYLEWYAKFNNWSTYAASDPAHDDQFCLSFYVIPDTPDPDEPETIDIAEALAAEDGTEGLSVKGVVTLLDGKNVYLQDSTGGICAYLSASPTDLSLGDTIIATGKRDTYNGLPELASATYETSSGLTLTPAVKTIGELTDADICTYVTLRNVEVTEVYDNNGQYSSPNITVTDGKDSIQLYKAVVDKNEDGSWPVKAGDVITITAAVGVYNTTLQLRNTTADEIVMGGTSSGPIYDGEQVVIYAPDYNKALSADYSGYYNKGTAVTVGTDGTLSGFTASDVWTVIDNGDGTWSFSYDGQKIGMDAEFTSMPLGGVNDQWVLEDAGDGLYYIKNTGRNAYMEWYDSKDYWSAYYNIASGSEGMFALAFYKVAEIPETPAGNLPEDGDKVVMYNLSAQGVLAGEGDNQVVNNAAATVENEAAIPANGGRVFTVEETDEGYYRFKTEHDGYLCSNGTGNNAFYSKDATNDADWTLTAGKSGGWNLESRTAKFNGQYSQYLEYFGGSYKTYSMYNVTDYDIYEFFFYPLAEGVTVTDGVVNIPTVNFGTLPDAYVGQDYTVTFTVDAVFGVAEGLTAKYGDTTAELTNENGSYSFTIPGTALTAEGELAITVSGADTKEVSFTGSAKITVKDEPYILEVFPAAGTQTGDDKQPEISFTFGNAGENPTITLKVGDETVPHTVEGNKASYTPAAAMADGRVTVTATVTRADNQSATKSWTFTIGTAEYQLYFGQLHSHTAEYSDGAGTLQEGLDYVAGLPDSANVDFVAFTDHSNYFDSSSNANPEAALYDPSQMTAESAEKWADYTGAVATFNASQSDVVALAGFEMTWSGGPGHINTFNTPGIVSRNNSTLNNKTDDAGMKAYYALLSDPELADSISQFNHPGSTFGTFSDFAYYDAIIDSRMYLVEVGNGEGAIGAGGYYPSYEYYIMALDKGWHVAPTNNQDNHKGKWGNANDARDVVLTDDFSEEGIYDAIRNYRVYATEDKNLEINYTLNGKMLGSTISEADTANIQVSVHDPDSTDSISKVEVVVNSGAVAYTWDDPAQLAIGELECSIPANYSYYFIRVTQGDGDLAVTAPVWIGEVVKLGVSSVECGTSTPVTGEELTLTTTLFNSESNPATVKSITYTSGSETLGTDTKGYELPASGTLAVDWKYTPTRARVMTITVTVVLEEDGIEYTYSKDISLDILDASKLVYIGIDASHYNEYVAGNYKDSMGNFSNLAAGYSVRTVQLNTSEDLIAACENESGKYKAIILTAPSRRDGTALRYPYVCYSDAEIQALKAFNAAGGTLVLAGWSDYYESYAEFPTADHMAAQQNKVLAALGSSLRIGDDATNDNELNGGQTQRLYFSTYNWDNFLVKGVEFDPENPNNNLYSQLFSQYGGASIYVVDEDGNPTTTIPDTVSPVVYGHASTYSVDSDNDGLGGDAMPKYAVAEGDERLMVLATEDLGDNKGLIIVSGAAFMSNFEVQAQIGDSGAEKNYSNYNICENLVNYLNPATITPIKDVQAQKDEGIKYTIEGVVTSNASGFDKDTAFFDCIYVQDDTAGINAFPVAGNYQIGDVVRITGTTSSYQGERQIAVTSIEKIGETSAPTPKVITAAELNDGSVLGSLVTLKGTVVSFEAANGLIQTILVRDEAGNVGRLFIDGYITTDKDVEDLAVGCSITATGLASYDNTFNAPEGPFPRIRVRDRADIVCTAAPSVDPGSGSEDGYDDDRTAPRPGQDDTDIPDSDTPLSAGVFTDLDSGAWYYDAVSDVVEQGLMVGVSSSSFAPGQQVSRSMLATVLYRMSGETWEGGQAGFPDVEPNTWYSDAVDWANAAGVVKGYDTGLFGVNDSITREQLVTMLYRYWLHLGGDASVQTDLTVFADAGTVSEYAREAMAWAVAQGLIQGRPGSLLAPAEGATRAELCTILVRFQALER